MPFYEYQCDKCGHHVEAMQKVTDAPLKKCPDCGKSALKRLLSAPVFRLKGSGWYETDFKSEQEKKRNLAKSEEDAPKEEKKDEKKDDKKASAADAAKPAAAPAKESKTPAVSSGASKPAASKAKPRRAAATSGARRPAARKKKR